MTAGRKNGEQTTGATALCRYRADHVVPVDPAMSVYSPGVVDVDGDRVVWVGPAEEAPARLDVEERRVEGALLPGLLNIHCHTPMLLLRGAGEGLPVDRWLREVMWPREARLAGEDVTAGMQLGAAELLENGITTSVEMYFHGESVAAAAASAGLRCVVTPPIIEDPQLSSFGPWKEQLAGVVALSERWADEARIDVGVGPHAPYSTSDPCLRAVAEVAVERGLLVHIHVAEQRWEDDAIRERTGLSAPAYLRSIGLLEARVLAAHSVWLSPEDIEIYAEHTVAVAHCPCSNCKHASGVAPVDALRAAGVRVGIATDGPASHHRLDLFEEMRMAIRLARVHHRESDRLGAHDALRMVTVEAASALGRSDLGHLTPGARADMLAIAVDRAEFQPVVPADDDLVSRLVWSGSPAAVRSVWVGGEVVVDAGRAIRVDVGAAIAEVNRRARELVT